MEEQQYVEIAQVVIIVLMSTRTLLLAYQDSLLNQSKYNVLNAQLVNTVQTLEEIPFLVL